MKIRIGFVSNSSSSSFIIHTKLTVEELKKFLRENGYDSCQDSVSANWYGFADMGGGWTIMYNDDEDIPFTTRDIMDKLKEIYGLDICLLESDSDY